MFRKITAKIKNRIITGIIVIIPIGLTAWIVWALYKFIGSRAMPLFENIPLVANMPVIVRMTISAIFTVMVIWLIGVFARNFIGRLILKWIETIILKTPVVSKIYKTVRQITNAILSGKQGFKRVGLIEYPRRGILTMVFITNDIISSKGDRLLTVFVPSSPNPTTGFSVIMPEDDVEILPITVNQAIEFIFSGGIVTPDNYTFPRIKRKLIGG